MNDIQKEILEIINRRERQMLIHSYLYYRKDEPIWDDEEFNKKALELRDLINNHSDIFQHSEWRDVFKDWDGTTGFHLPLDNPWVQGTAEHLLSINKANEYVNETNATIQAQKKEEQRVRQLIEAQIPKEVKEPTKEVKVEKTQKPKQASLFEVKKEKTNKQEKQKPQQIKLF